MEDQGGVTSSWVELLHTFSGAWDAWVGGWYEVHRWGTHYILGRVENQKSWKITKPQVDPIDAHKNKTFNIFNKCFVSKTPLENAKIGSARPL